MWAERASNTRRTRMNDDSRARGRRRPMLHQQVSMAFVTQLFAVRRVVRHELADDAPEARRVIHLDEMGDFVRDDVIEQARRHLHQPPIEVYAAARMATSPARARARQEHSRRALEPEEL